MITREAIQSGTYLEHFERMPDMWSKQKLEQSLHETLAQRPGDCDEFWVFAYGSLMWNPLVHVEQVEVATLHDWHRAFCLHMTTGRASPEMPGRMLALEPGGQANGVVLRLPRADAEDELKLLWIREMILGSYVPTWAPVTLANGTRTHAIAFVANPVAEQYEPDSSIATVAPLIRSAAGAFGTNVEYLHRLINAMAQYDAHDSYLDSLADAIGAIPQEDVDSPAR